MKFLAALAGCLLLAACNSTNMLVLGTVQATLGSHAVVVTDCYRTSVPPPRMMQDGAAELVYRFTPCKDADVMIRGESLIVNGKSYGPLKAGDRVTVDHGEVLINGKKPPAR